MPETTILTPEQREDFERWGVLRLPGLLSAVGVEAAREAVLGRLAQLGLWRDGAWRLDDAPRPRWPQPGVSAKALGAKNPEVAALIEEWAVQAVADELLGGRDHDRTIHKRPQVLVTLPNIDAWALPQGWHVDFPRLASNAAPGVQLFACLDHVAPRGGATLVVAGSHRLLNAGRFIRSGEVMRPLRREPFFRELCAGGGSELPRGRVDGVELQVAELTGAPGDVWFTDLRLAHAAAPNASPTPRMAITHRFVRTDLVPELAAGFGWTAA